MRHFLDITDLTSDELRHVLALSELPTGALGRPLDGRGVSLIEPRITVVSTGR